MSDILKCKLCNYQSKQLFQHIKAVHDMTVEEYRNKFGKNEKMQINFNKREYKVDKKMSKCVKDGYNRIFNNLDNIKDLYSIEDTLSLLNNDFYYKNYFGKSKNRTLIRENPKLYKSIYHHTKILENEFSKIGKCKSNYSFVKRMIFLVERNSNIDSLRCECGKTYTWNTYCRYCPNPKRTNLGKTASDEFKLKCRKSALKFLEKVNGQLLPRYNPKSIPVIERVARKMGITDLQHAENGGEYYVKEIGYWVDGYSKEKNTVIEYDESHHFDSNGKLKDRDVRRQREIEEYLKCKFVRINSNGEIYKQ